jgi:glycosyltransferase involved in cell wall biosynthesis
MDIHRMPTTSIMPGVSIVIPTRNRRHLIELALASVLRQQDADIEVIVVDDASTDDTAAILSRLAHRGVRLVRQPSRGGVSAARNRGIGEASGEWIAFLDDDDVWAPEKLRRQLEAVTGAGLTWVYAGDVNVDEGLRVLSGSAPPTPDQVMEAMSRYNPVPTGASNVMVRADALAEAGPFDPQLRRTEDWDMWIRLARTGPPAYVPHPLVAYRFHGANIMDDMKAIIDEPDLLAVRYGIPVDRAAMQRRAAWCCLRAGHRLRAVRHYAQAVGMGDLRSLARAAVALAHPAAASDRLFGLAQGARVGVQWQMEAQAWLDQFARERLGSADQSMP